MIPKKTRKFLKSFDNIFTLNYDNNIEVLTDKKVYHLHGDFSVLSNSENENNVVGYIRSIEGTTVYFEDMRHCFCNALLNYSGELKYKVAKDNHELINESKSYKWKYENDPNFMNQLSQLKNGNPFEHKMIMAKIEHPALNMATEYYFDRFEDIKDELHIIGMSPNNDSHIFNSIFSNKDISKVIYYYHSDKEKQYIEKNYSKELFECKSVIGLWESLDSMRPKHRCNYDISLQIDKLIDCFNGLSTDPVSKERILSDINKIPPFEMIRLCKLVKEDMITRNPEHNSMDENELIQSNASISYIALQEGILPSVLFVICVMHFNYIKDTEK